MRFLRFTFWALILVCGLCVGASAQTSPTTTTVPPKPTTVVAQKIEIRIEKTPSGNLLVTIDANPSGEKSAMKPRRKTIFQRIRQVFAEPVVVGAMIIVTRKILNK